METAVKSWHETSKVDVECIFSLMTTRHRLISMPQLLILISCGEVRDQANGSMHKISSSEKGQLMCSYKGIEQCKYNVVSIFKATAPEQPAENPPLLQLERPTPNKKAKTEDYKPGSSCQKTSPDNSTENTTMEDETEDGELKQIFWCVICFHKNNLHASHSFVVCDLQYILCSLWQQRFCNVSLRM